MLAPIIAYWTIGLAVLVALLLAIGIWWLWWQLPKREVARLALNDPKARADVEDNYRKTVGQALGGLAVLIGAVSAYLQFSQQQRASHDLLISNQVSKGFELLGNKDAVVVRLGGIYALEGVMNNSDQYYRAVLEALTAFVRDGTKARDNTPSSSPPTDIQAALTVIGRRTGGQGVVDLAKANIAVAALGGANLAHADLRDANLTSTSLFAANLAYALLGVANLTGADLREADLREADLTSAKLPGANLTGANLTDANLTRANLTVVQIDQKQLDTACGSDAVLPPGLTLKACPSQSSP
jgi:Pentapeptide repeats (8 copies)